MKSKYLAKKRYSEELERFVTDSEKEAEELNNKIMQQDKEIMNLRQRINAMKHEADANNAYFRENHK